MKTLRQITVLICSFGVAICPYQCRAESSGGQDSAPLNRDEQGTSNRNIITNPALTFFGEAITGRWAFSGDAGFDQEYSDNVFSSAIERVSDNTSRISIRGSLAVQKKRLSAQFHYAPNYLVYAKYSTRNALSQEYGQEIGYKLSAHSRMKWTLFANRSRGENNTPFQFVNFGATALPIFHPEALQNNILTTSAFSSMGLSHSFSARSGIQASISGSIITFKSENTTPGAPFLGSKNYSGLADIGWNYEVSPGRQIGVELADGYFAFLNPSFHTHFMAVKLRYAQELGRGFNFSVGGGPSYSISQPRLGSSVALRDASVAADGFLTHVHRALTVGVTANYGTQTAQTQGSLAALIFSGFASRRFGRKWETHTSISYSRSHSTGFVAGNESSSFSTTAGVNYQLPQNLGVNASYSYVNQGAAAQVMSLFSNYDGNLYSIGLHYSFRLTAER